MSRNKDTNVNPYIILNKKQKQIAHCYLSFKIYLQHQTTKDLFTYLMPNVNKNLNEFLKNVSTVYQNNLKH